MTEMGRAAAADPAPADGALESEKAALAGKRPRVMDRLLASRTFLIAMAAQLVQSAAGLAVLPFMVTRLSAAEVGIWYIFVAVQGLAIIADFGFQPTLARAIAVGFAGGEELQKRGLVINAAGEVREPNFRLVAQVLGAARRLYLWLALGMLAVLLLVGTPYISWLATKGGLPLFETQIAWVLFAVAIALNLYLLWISPLLIGSGRVEFNYLYLVLGRGGFAVAGILILIAGGGLIALSFAMIGSLLLGRLAAQFFIAPLIGAVRKASTGRIDLSATLKALSPNAVRMGCVMIGGFLIQRYSLFAISSFNGLAVSGAYAISLQLFTALSAVSQMPMQISTKQLVAARLSNDRRAMRHLLLRNLGILVAVFVAGSLVILFVLPVLLRLIGSNVNLIPALPLALLGLVMLLETHHSGAAFFITTGNEVPFLQSALISGVAVAVLMTGVSWLGWGLTAVIASQGLVQLTYNNWQWPLRAWRETRE